MADTKDKKVCFVITPIGVVSPSNPGHDYDRKLNLYMNKGVREYWIVDPDKNQVMI